MAAGVALPVSGEIVDGDVDHLLYRETHAGQPVGLPAALGNVVKTDDGASVRHGDAAPAQGVQDPHADQIVAAEYAAAVLR